MNVQGVWWLGRSTAAAVAAVERGTRDETRVRVLFRKRPPLSVVDASALRYACILKSLAIRTYESLRMKVADTVLRTQLKPSYDVNAIKHALFNRVRACTYKLQEQLHSRSTAAAVCDVHTCGSRFAPFYLE